MRPSRDGVSAAGSLCYVGLHLYTYTFPAPFRKEGVADGDTVIRDLPLERSRSDFTVTSLLPLETASQKNNMGVAQAGLGQLLCPPLGRKWVVGDVSNTKYAGSERSRHSFIPRQQ